MSDLKYPIGKYSVPESYSHQAIDSWIDTIAKFPIEIRKLTKDLSLTQLNWQYRPEGWTIKQVVHHCADSHMNSFIRFKWTLTEDSPVIKAYHEDRWAELPDSLDDDISSSLLFIQALHAKWVNLLKSLTPAELDRTFTHPETGKKITLKQNIGLYAWHCEHHLAHIRQAIKSEGIF